jgi:hypothetical protein
MMLQEPPQDNKGEPKKECNALSHSLFDSFKTISLDELDKMKLLGRFDSKFVFHRSKLESIINQMADDYHVLKINNQTVFHYESTYLDTDDFKLYLMHHNGKPERIKVRWRKYTDIQKIFFEVKCKTSRKKTEKIRTEEPAVLPELNQAQSELIASLGYQDYCLKPKITISYDRITMVSKSENIKVTLDMNIRFENMMGAKDLPHLVVAEVKSRRLTPKCIFIETIKKFGIRQGSFSKYATGTAILELVKHNAFKPELLLVTKINNERS